MVFGTAVDLESQMNDDNLPNVIRINVGGTHYETLLSTLRSEESMLSSMFSGKHRLERDKDGCPFIDRPGDDFGYILNYLRDNSVIPPNSVALQVYTEALYYQISSLITKLESTPSVFRHRLKKASMEKFENLEAWKQMLIEKAQRKSENDLTLQVRVNFMTSSDKKLLEEPPDCVVNDHLMSICGRNNRQETLDQTKQRLENAEIICDDRPGFNMELFTRTVEKVLQSEGYHCDIWVENLKCSFKSNFSGRQCRFQVQEYIAEFKWE